MAKTKRMPSVQQMLGYPPKSLVIDGENYRLGFNDQDAKGRLEEIIGSRVWDKVYSEADRMKNGDRHIKRYEQQFAEGYYATMGEGWRQEVLCPSGVFVFFLSLMQEHQPGMTLEEATGLFQRDPVRCAHAIAAVAPDFFKAVLRQMGATEEMIEKSAPDLKKMVETLTQEPATAPTS